MQPNAEALRQVGVLRQEPLRDLNRIVLPLPERRQDQRGVSQTRQQTGAEGPLCDPLIQILGGRGDHAHVGLRGTAALLGEQALDGGLREAGQGVDVLDEQRPALGVADGLDEEPLREQVREQRLARVVLFAGRGHFGGEDAVEAARPPAPLVDLAGEEYDLQSGLRQDEHRGDPPSDGLGLPEGVADGFGLAEDRGVGRGVRHRAPRVVGAGVGWASGPPR